MKYIILPLLLFIPFVSMADDHCTNPNEYTIDKRCYVTDEQKETAPYNASVALVKNVDGKYENYCSGTIVKGPDGTPYLYTAAHCVGKRDRVYFRLPTGSLRLAYLKNIGNADDAEQDWAILRIFEKDIPMVEISNKKQTEYGSENAYRARVIGYGGLKIMSDEEITEFKTRYANFLKDKYSADDSKSLEYEIGGGINPIQSFIDDNIYYYYSLENDSKNLKVSNCKYTNHGSAINCQAWSGDSGGGVFDKDDKIMAIHTRGVHLIGGKFHAGGLDKGFPSKDLNLPIKNTSLSDND